MSHPPHHNTPRACRHVLHRQRCCRPAGPLLRGTRWHRAGGWGAWRQGRCVSTAAASTPRQLGAPPFMAAAEAMQPPQHAAKALLRSASPRHCCATSKGAAVPCRCPAGLPVPGLPWGGPAAGVPPEGPASGGAGAPHTRVDRLCHGAGHPGGNRVPRRRAGRRGAALADGAAGRLVDPDRLHHV